MNKRIIKITATTLAVLVVAAAGYFGYTKTFGKSKTTASANTYIIETVSKGSITQSIQATGSAFAASTKDVVPNNSGELQNFSLKVGNTVKKGQVLFTVSNDQLQQAVDSAKLKLQQQQVTLSNLEQQLASQTSSQGQQGSQGSQTVNQTSIDLQELQVQSAQDSLDQAEQQFNQMTVTSPINGVVTAVNNANGDQVQPGSAVLTITDPTSIKIDTQVDELDISKVKIGQKAQITFNAIQNQTYTGTVDSIANIGSSSNNVTTYDVVLDLDSNTGIMVGMTANVNIEVASKSNILVIPAEALIDKGNQTYVMVQDSSTPGTQQNGQQGVSSSNSNGGSYQGSGQDSNSSGQNGTSGSSRVRGAFGGTTSTPGKLVQVQLGLQTETEVEVTSGLQEGDKLMVQMPKVSSGTTNTGNSSSKGMSGLGGFGGGIGGGNFGGGGSGRSGN